MQKRLDIQKVEYEEAIKRHISFIDQVFVSKHYYIKQESQLLLGDCAT